MSSIARKPVFGVSDHVRNKPGHTLEAENFGFRKKRDCTIYVAKAKALISCAVTAQLICSFVLAYAKSRLSHDTAHIMRVMCVKGTEGKAKSEDLDLGLHYLPIPSYLKTHIHYGMLQTNKIHVT